MILQNLKEPLNFYVNNLNNNKIKWKKSRIRKLLYNLREESYPKDDECLKLINNITINLNNKENNNQSFCLYKGEFININKDNKLEKFIISSSKFQINLFTEIDELFLDSTFKICPHNWYQLLNIFVYIKNKGFYLHFIFVLMSSKSEELYLEVFSQLHKIFINLTNNKTFPEIKIMWDFEISMRKAIKATFNLCKLQGGYFHYCKAIRKKIKKLHLFKNLYE